MLLDFAKIPVEPVANMRGGQGTVLLQKTVQGPVGGYCLPARPLECIPMRPIVK